MEAISSDGQRKNPATAPPSCLSRGEEGRRAKGRWRNQLQFNEETANWSTQTQRWARGWQGSQDAQSLSEPRSRSPLPRPPHALSLTSLGGVAEIVVGGAGPRIVPEFPAAQTEGPADRRFFQGSVQGAAPGAGSRGTRRSGTSRGHRGRAALRRRHFPATARPDSACQSARQGRMRGRRPAAPGASVRARPNRASLSTGQPAGKGIAAADTPGYLLELLKIIIFPPTWAVKGWVLGENRSQLLGGRARSSSKIRAKRADLR